MANNIMGWPPTPSEQAEADAVEMLMNVCEGITPEIAKLVFKKHNYNIETAANAIIEGDRGEPSTWPVMPPLEPAIRGTLNSSRPRSPLPSRPEREGVNLIDLTGDDDDDMAKALKMSLEETTNNTPVRGRSPGPTFQRSDRAPDPSWAMVSSNAPVPTTTGTGMTQDEERFQRAIEASLEESFNTDEPMEEVPLEKRVRRGDQPIALRPAKGSLSYAALVLHALFFIPQVRLSFMKWAKWAIAHDTSGFSYDESAAFDLIGTLTEIYTNMEHAAMLELSVDAALNSVDAVPWDLAIERPGDLSQVLLSRLASIAEVELHRRLGDWKRLFHYRYCSADTVPNPTNGPLDPGLDRVVVKVEIPDDTPKNDLVSCLAAQFARSQPRASGPTPITAQQLDHQLAITEASDVVAFQLVRVQSYSSDVKKAADKGPFRYPKHIYMDQFMKENVALASQMRDEEWEISLEVAKLTQRREELTKHKGKETLPDLRAALYYYETIAQHNGDNDRKAQIQDVAMRLRKTIARLENEIETMDAQISRLQRKSSNLFDYPELQKHRYDLKAVLVHDGLFGRLHVHSYVEQNGVWWKTVDHMVTEVTEETVLRDATGLHLGAGPYFLLYARELTSEEETELQSLTWPSNLVSDTEDNNKSFLNSLPADVLAQLIESGANVRGLDQIRFNNVNNADGGDDVLDTDDFMESQVSVMDTST